jgi:hypothetical protein
VGCRWYAYLVESAVAAASLLFIVKHPEKICSVFGRHLISINFLLRRWEGYYAYSSIVGGFLHL